MSLWICLACTCFMATSSLYYVAFECEQCSKADICSKSYPSDSCQGSLTGFTASNRFCITGTQAECVGCSCVSRASYITLCVWTAQMFRNHVITQKRLICAFDTVLISLSMTLTTQMIASVSSARCIGSKIAEAVFTEVVFRMDVPKFDSFASATDNKLKAFCFGQVCLWFLGAAWPMSCWKVLKHGFGLFSLLLGELGR